MDYKLQLVTETYKYQEGKEIYFLNSENKPIKVKSITKVLYSDKIYDGDVDLVDLGNLAGDMG